MRLLSQSNQHMFPIGGSSLDETSKLSSYRSMGPFQARAWIRSVRSSCPQPGSLAEGKRSAPLLGGGEGVNPALAFLGRWRPIVSPFGWAKSFRREVGRATAPNVAGRGVWPSSRRRAGLSGSEWLGAPFSRAFEQSERAQSETWGSRSGDKLLSPFGQLPGFPLVGADDEYRSDGYYVCFSPPLVVFPWNTAFVPRR